MFYLTALGQAKLKKVSGSPAWSIFLRSENTLTDRQIIMVLTWSISEGRMDQKQIINFVRPYLNALVILDYLSS